LSWIPGRIDSRYIVAHRTPRRPDANPIKPITLHVRQILLQKGFGCAQASIITQPEQKCRLPIQRESRALDAQDRGTAWIRFSPAGRFRKNRRGLGRREKRRTLSQSNDEESCAPAKCSQA